MKTGRANITPSIAKVASITLVRRDFFPVLRLAVSLLMLLLALMFLGVTRTLAAENDFDVIPRWIRPDRSITVKLGPKVDITTQLYLRLTSRTSIKDFPLSADQMQRRVVEIWIPDTVSAGVYETSLVDNNGRDLGYSGSRLKIAASDKAEEKPVITKIVPIASYPKHGRYNFDIVGENFGTDVRSVKILINDTEFIFDQTLQKHSRKTSAEECQANQACLVWSWKKLGVRGLSLEGQQINRPMAVSIAVDGIESDKVPIILSPVNRLIPAFIAFATLGVVTLLVYLMYRRKASLYLVSGRRYHTMACLFIDPKTNTYSLSQLQLVLWSAAAIVAYVYLAASRALVQWDWRLCEVPENLPMLLGISAGTTVLSIGATGFRGSKGAGPLHPEWGDFISSGGVFAPERFQFFIWTIIGVFSFVSATLAQDPASVSELPRIPDSFVPLMGISSVGYLAGKVTRKAGPNISRIISASNAAGALTIRILGENLSPRAQVTINGTLLQTEEVAVGPGTPADAEFVTELLVTPNTVSLTEANKIDVKIVNPDGQSAEMTKDKKEVTQPIKNPAGNPAGGSSG